MLAHAWAASGAYGSHSGVRRSTSRPVRLIESQVI
jgi:hypothetical protein